MNINEYIKRKCGNRTQSQPEADDTFRPKDAPSESTVEAYERLSKMNEEQLMSEMFRAAHDGRQSGEINDETLDRFYQTAQSFLTPEQAERMRELIIQLKQ